MMTTEKTMKLNFVNYASKENSEKKNDFMYKPYFNKIYEWYICMQIYTYIQMGWLKSNNWSCLITTKHRGTQSIQKTKQSQDSKSSHQHKLFSLGITTLNEGMYACLIKTFGMCF